MGKEKEEENHKNKVNKEQRSLETVRELFKGDEWVGKAKNVKNLIEQAENPVEKTVEVHESESEEEEIDAEKQELSEILENRQRRKRGLEGAIANLVKVQQNQEDDKEEEKDVPSENDDTTENPVLNPEQFLSLENSNSKENENLVSIQEAIEMDDVTTDFM